MAESTVTFSIDDDPEITILNQSHLINDDPVLNILNQGRWEPWRPIKRSKLTKHSGFFRRMFSHDFMETRKNEVILHEDDMYALFWLLGCIDKGSMGLEPYRDYHFFSDPLRPDAHDSRYERIVTVYELLDKYDCEGFKPGCRHILCASLHAGLEASWDADGYIVQHYEYKADQNDGEYPERLYPLLAESWRVFAIMGRPCPKLTAVIDGNHELTTAIAKYYRDELVRLMAPKRPVEE